MKIALVHDYLNEFGGAERVLAAFCEIWPKAPIYTAFYREGSPAYNRFKEKEILTSWAQKVPFFALRLHSPLRFLAPLVWNSFDFSDYDVVLSSSSWFVTKGFGKRDTKTKSQRDSGPVEICYCHTPPRYLYGYATSVDWRKHFWVRIYAAIVNHFMRVYDFESAQKVDFFIANSKEVASRIKKFYRRESTVIYPPVDTKKFQISNFKSQISNKSASPYFLVVSRLVASKNVNIVVEACAKLGLPLKIVGGGKDLDSLKKLADGKENIEFLGEILDKELVKEYQNCRAVIFAASHEDFGLVPVEAMAAGKPVVVLAEGGVLESVVDGKTGVYFEEATVEALELAIKKFIELEKKGVFDPKFIKKHAKKFGKERFKKEIREFIESKLKK